MSAQSMVEGLIAAGLNAEAISEALDKRVSRRTIYRWLKGESQPQQARDLQELQKLYEEKVNVSP